MRYDHVSLQKHFKVCTKTLSKVRSRLGIEMYTKIDKETFKILEKEMKDRNIGYDETYKQLIEKGYMTGAELRWRIGTTNTQSILSNFEDLDEPLYDELMDFERVAYRPHRDKTKCKRVLVYKPLKVIFAQWEEERKELPKKNGFIVTNQRRLI